MPYVKYIDLELKDYKETWDYQEQLFQNVLQEKKENPDGDFGGYLLFVEHPHVFTLGKSGKTDNLLISEPLLKQIGAAFYTINRGGDITYHGPGQIVGYPVLDLEKFGFGIREYIEKLEEAMICSLETWQITGERHAGATGVWLEAQTAKARKICAIGVRVSHFVTMHGFALNINTDLNYFSYINPCGFQDKGVTSVRNECHQLQDFQAAKQTVKENIGKIFQMQWE